MDKDPLVFWFTGGPGCSSMLALFKENGPFNLNDNGELVLRKHSWHNQSNIVFVDQPRNVGFS